MTEHKPDQEKKGKHDKDGKDAIVVELLLTMNELILNKKTNM